MPFTFIFVGLFLIIASAKGQASALFTLVHDDFVPPDGSRGFVTWIAAMLAVGALGYIPKFQTASRALLVLILIGLFVSNSGFFAQLQKQFPQIFSAKVGA